MRIETSSLCRVVGILCTAIGFLSSDTGGADITFFGYSDIHYGAVNRQTGASIVKSPMVEVINTLPGKAYPEEMGGVIERPRGVIMAGDLINDGALADKYPAQWADFLADFGVNGEGRCRFPVFEGAGNHDLNENLFVFNQIRVRNQIRMNLGLISNVSSNGYHYSWDWDEIHFVNVNLFPGNRWEGEADAYGRAHDPMGALDFLEDDLREHVGDTGRPVIMVQHFRPIDDNWWTYAAADKCHRVLQDYNVILIMNGHQGGGVNNLWRGIHWASSNGELNVFRISADNALFAGTRRDEQWRGTLNKSITLSYDSSGLAAVVNNGDWVSNVTGQAATVSGKILYEAVLPTEVTLYWGREDGGADETAWEYSQRIGVQTAGSVFRHRVTGLEPWTQYYYRCRVSNARGDGWAAASIPFSTNGVLPTPWKTTLIGHEQRPWGGAHHEDGVFTVRGSGRDIGERGQRIDNFQYACRSVMGDCVITARIDSMAGKNRDPKVGVMLRETLAKDARAVSILLSGKTGLRLFCRSDRGGSTMVSDRSDLRATPIWVRIGRVGQTFTGYWSEDGQEWTQAGESVSVDMTSEIQAGLAVTAGNRDGSRLHTARFSEVSVTHAKAQTGRDVTFLHISDQHYAVDSKDDTLASTIRAMNETPGIAYPPEIGGGAARPRGVILTGDLTNNGTPEGWKKFTTHWGLTGTEGLIRYPVYEGVGNHDGKPSTSQKNGAGYVRRQIVQRNKRRVGVTSVSDNGLHYAWDWDDVHFVQLNEYAGAENDQRYEGNVAYGRKRQSYGNPAEESLQFLAKDLASRVGASGRPVVLIQHYGLAGFPIHPWGDEAAWWTEEQALRLWETIEGYNVIAILGGHDGSENVFDWHGIPNRLMDDTVRFGLYHITDDQMTVAKRNSQTGQWETHWTQSTAINASQPPELVQGPYLIYSGRPDEMTVCWRTRANVPCTLKWDDDQFFYKDGSVEVTAYNRDLHLYRHTITGLKPNSSVNYALKINGKYAPGMFYAVPAGSDRVKLLITGGARQTGDRDRLYRAMYDKIYQDAAYHSILIHGGAMASNAEAIHAWDQECFSRDRDARHMRYVLSRLPVVRAPGGGSLERQLFPYSMERDGCCSFDYGPVHIAVLRVDAASVAKSEALDWLKSDLASSRAAWKLVVVRHASDQWTDAVETICRDFNVALCVWNGCVYRAAGQGREAYRRVDLADTLLAVQIEDDALTCQLVGQ